MDCTKNKNFVKIFSPLICENRTIVKIKVYLDNHNHLINDSYLSTNKYTFEPFFVTIKFMLLNLYTIMVQINTYIHIWRNTRISS